MYSDPRTMSKLPTEVQLQYLAAAEQRRLLAADRLARRRSRRHARRH
jgi:hypothetical protein